MRLVLPRLYVILDSALLTIPVQDCAQELADAGVRLLQYRDKTAPSRDLLHSSRSLASLLTPQGITFIVNDRADVAVLAGASGVHVGQDDLEVEQARALVGERKVGRCVHPQPRAVSSGCGHFGGLHRGGTCVCDHLESESRSGDWHGVSSPGPRLERQAHCGHRRDHAGKRGFGDRGGRGLRRGDQRYFGRAGSRAASEAVSGGFG